MSDVWQYIRPKLKDGTKEKRIVEIVFNEVEEKAILRYAEKHKITYGEGVQRIIDAMTKGLLEIAVEDNEFDEIEGTNTKIETLDNNAPDNNTP